MSEMIERVAKAWRAQEAMWTVVTKNHGTVATHNAVSTDGGEAAFSTLEKANEFISEQCAHAAIEAMREPTDAMADAAYQFSAPREPTSFQDMWQQAIDAALKETAP